ncbi:MAG: hypothetical protein L6Q84_29375 [Polyangiaceae bacterium]|nr:hypothetical protein [Polyangiaceae bacterium]
MRHFQPEPPGQIEACNRRDDDCDGQVDEELLNCPK